MLLYWHDYKYFPYEKELALREVRSLLRPSRIHVLSSGVRVEPAPDDRLVNRLVYFSGAKTPSSVVPTLQHRLETAASPSRKPRRQSTRYSVHGLHDYKGRFNPQVVRGILNALGITHGSTVLDPFVGVGTTLVECTHIGLPSIGADLNPLAVFLSNAKVAALSTPSNHLARSFEDLVDAHKGVPRFRLRDRPSTARMDYLRRWFHPSTLASIELIYELIGRVTHPHTEVFLALASDLLRDHSLQEPSDLRIRRRKSPPPATTFWDALQRKAASFIEGLASTQATIGVPQRIARAILADSRHIEEYSNSLPQPFHAVVTSPPYATALPYIDTQRLSIVWLGLTEPDSLRSQDAIMIGSREVPSNDRASYDFSMISNERRLPTTLHTECLRLHNAVTPPDGFRRRAVPALLYRYLSDMRDSFTAVLTLLSPGAPYALIVGQNRTTLGGKTFTINTPEHLAEAAISSGFRHEETIPLQTYQRYGIHASNAVRAESLIILRKS